MRGTRPATSQMGPGSRRCWHLHRVLDIIFVMLSLVYLKVPCRSLTHDTVLLLQENRMSTPPATHMQSCILLERGTE